MNYKPIESCTTVAELLGDPARWTQGVPSRDSAGQYAPARSARACQWCPWGAMRRIYGLPWTEEFAKAEFRVEAVIGDNFVSWNDAPGRTHAEVLDAVKRAGI